MNPLWQEREWVRVQLLFLGLWANPGEEGSGYFSSISLSLFSPHQAGILNQKMNKHRTTPSTSLGSWQRQNLFCLKSSSGHLWKSRTEVCGAGVSTEWGKYNKGFISQKKKRKSSKWIPYLYIYLASHIHKRSSETSTWRFLKLAQEIKRRGIH